MRHFLIATAFLLLSGCANVFMQAHPDTSYKTYSARKLHHIKGGFQNVGDFTPTKGAGWRHLISDPFSEDFIVPEDFILSSGEIDRQLRAEARKPISITWIGHSTLVVRIGNTRILTDPLFGKRASPLVNVGPRRSVDAALRVEDLPPIDAIVVSHNHYDHLDSRAMRQLAKINPDTLVLMPLGNGGTARRAGFTDVRELDWYDRVTFGNVAFTLVPAVHSSRRGFLNTNKALWGGWSIAGAGKRIYFSGDTGFGSFIRDIRDHIGRHHVALVPIGAYRPPEVEAGFHTTPEEAVRMARILEAQHILPIHWGTIAMTSEPFEEQRQRYLRAGGNRKGVHLLKIGGTLGIR